MKSFMSVCFVSLLAMGLCAVSFAADCGCAAPAPVADCGPACGPVCDPCGPREICTPFNGFFLNLFSRPVCEPCAPVCEPCAPAPAPAVCAPCAPACEPVCVKPCALPCAPFNGFFRNLFAPACGCGCEVVDCGCAAPVAPACN